MTLLHTERLEIRDATPADAPFLLELLNDPDFIAHIADRGVRTEQQARDYLRDGPIASYRDNGFGMWVVRRRGDAKAVGMAGLVRRAGLDDVDLGYAFLPGARGQGYALEAARRVMRHAREDLGLARLVAIVDPDNPASIALLEKLGMTFERMIRLTPEDDEIRLYAIN